VVLPNQAAGHKASTAGNPGPCRLTFAVAMFFHVPHHALMVAPRQFLSNHLQLPKPPVREVSPTQLSETRKVTGMTEAGLQPRCKGRPPSIPHGVCMLEFCPEVTETSLPRCEKTQW
jgi:hypothetical protein